jgi:hypothetical protein
VRAWARAALGWILLVAACGESDAVPRADAGAPPVPDMVRPAEEPAPPQVHAPLAAGAEIEIPAGLVRAGSVPGTPGRDPRNEADLVPVAVPAFAIDRLPYPNDPSAPPRTGVAREEAMALCEADGKRLCSELEWERACKGDTTRAFPGGAGFDVEACSLDPFACASPHDVLALGVTVFEWTSSDVSRRLGSERWSAVVRGGRATDPATEHRCGARHALAPETANAEVGFRCCRGPSPDLAYPDEQARRTFREEAIDAEQARTILRGVPELARFADGFTPVGATGVDRALARGGASRESVQFHFVEDEALVWSPMFGEEIWLLAGTFGGSAIVAALHPMPDGSFVHGASFVLRDEDVPIVLAWDRTQPAEVLWSACWGCAGEGGAVTMREDRTVVVVQR